MISHPIVLTPPALPRGVLPVPGRVLGETPDLLAPVRILGGIPVTILELRARSIIGVVKFAPNGSMAAVTAALEIADILITRPKFVLMPRSTSTIESGFA